MQGLRFLAIVLCLIHVAAHASMPASPQLQCAIARLQRFSDANTSELEELVGECSGI